MENIIREEVDKGGDSRLVAVGEIGLGELVLRPLAEAPFQCQPLLALTDYDRLHHSSAETQKEYLPWLLSLAQTYDLPMFLHSRHPDAHKDLVDAFVSAGWKKGVEQPRGRTGVVHSFTGMREEMEELVSLASKSELIDSCQKRFHP